LLHKTKDEIEFDHLQRASLDGEDHADSPDPTNEAAALDMDTGFYVQEALDAGCDYNYFDNSPALEREEGQVIYKPMSGGRFSSLIYCLIMWGMF